MSCVDGAWHSPSLRSTPQRGVLGSLFWGWRFGLVISLGLQGNLLTYDSKICQDFCICKTNHFQTKAFKQGSAFFISSHAFWSVVLYAIKFNHQFTGGAIKIHNELPYWALPQPALWLLVQKFVPQFAFWLGHCSSQFLRSSCQFFVVSQPCHPSILSPFPHPAPLFEGSSAARGSGRT
jgi:hypothetical protein